MKVLHTIQGLSRRSGGPSTCTLQLIDGLRAAGVDAHVLAIDTLDNIAAADYLHYVPNDCRTPLAISRNYARYLDANVQKFDVVHANALWMWTGHQAALAAGKSGRPFILSPHGMLYPQALRVSSWKKRLVLPLFQRRDLEHATVLHATCEEELRHIRDFGLRNPVAVIPNCVPIDSSISIRTTPNDIRRIGFVGRIDPIKNIDRLIQAWARLGDSTKDAELVIIGQGSPEYESELKALAENLGIKNLRFTGFLSGQALKDAVAALDFQVLPSKSENFGMVVPEALLAGVPVIASKGTPWQILHDEQCGWWVDNDVATLASALSEALTVSETDRLAMGRRGRRLVIDRFSTPVVADQMKQLYDWALNNRPRPSFVNTL